MPNINKHALKNISEQKSLKIHIFSKRKKKYPIYATRHEALQSIFMQQNLSKLVRK
jgi:hypothetical protein